MLAALTPIGHLTPEAWDESVAVNLTGQWHMIRIRSASSCRAGRAPFWSRRVPLSEQAVLGALCGDQAGLEALGRSWAGGATDQPEDQHDQPGWNGDEDACLRFSG